MRYRPLGHSGLLVSTVGLGCNNFGGRLDLDGTRAVVDAALDYGVTLFDTAESYGGAGRSELLLGEVLKGRRDEVVLATKFGSKSRSPYGPAVGARGSRSWIRRSVEASLQRLQTDYIDLYQLHHYDPITPLEETVAAMAELVTEGKVRYLGHSNLAGWQLATVAHLCRELGTPPFISAQNHYSLLEREIEAEVIPAAEHYGVGILPYFPLANGLLTGKVSRATPPAEGTRLASMPDFLTERALEAVEALNDFARQREISLLEIAIGGLAAQPMVGSVIAGATSAAQIAANVAAAEWTPDQEDLAALDKIVPSRRPA
jgi:aryl-alcohol dehydrogenase-like predicted oxidoreductase